jgi:hypothetical protein
MQQKMCIEQTVKCLSLLHEDAARFVTNWKLGHFLAVTRGKAVTAAAFLSYMPLPPVSRLYLKDLMAHRSKV